MTAKGASDSSPMEEAMRGVTPLNGHSGPDANVNCVNGGWVTNGTMHSNGAVLVDEAGLRDFVENAAIALHWVGADGTILWANQAELDLLGYAPEEYVGKNIAAFHADEPIIQDILTRLTCGETLHNYAARLRCKDGSIRHVVISSNVLFDNGKFVHTRCFTRDVTREKQAEVILSGHSRALEQIASGEELAVILRTLTEVVEEQSEHRIRASILLLDESGRLRLGAAPHLPEAYNKAIDGIAIGPSVGSCGTAAFRKTTVVVEDISTDPLWADFKELAASHELRACWSTPILSKDEKVLGTFALYYDRPHVPSAAERLVVSNLTRTASIAIESARAQEALRQSERHLHEIVEALPAALYTTDSEGRITMFNRAAVEFSGRVPTLGSDSWCVTWKLYWPDGTPLPHDQCPMAMALKEGRAVLGYEAIAERPDGARRHFAPYPTPLYDEAGKLKGAVNMLVDITEQKRAQESLRENEERLRAIFKSSAVGVAVLTPDAQFLQANDAFCSITGYSEEELRHLNCAYLTDPEDCAAMGRELAQLLSGAISTFVIEKRYFRKDGVMIWVQNSVSLTRDAAGRPQHIVALCQEITERKRAEQAVRNRTAQFETLLDSAPLGVYLVDQDFRLREVNPTARSVFGDLPNLVGRDFDDVLHTLWPQADADGLVARFRHTLHTGESYVIREWGEDRLDRGKREYYDWQINRIPLPEGGYGVVCYVSDVSRQVFARQAIADSEERLRFMAESMPQKIFTAKANGDVDYFNRQWMDFTGLSFDEIKNWGWRQFIHPEDVDENVRLWQHSLDTGEPFKFVHRFRRFDGVYRWHLSRAHAMRDASGRVLMWIGSNTEIHEQKETEEQLRRANVDLEQFAYSASHDLQEPIRNVSVYGEILNTRYGEVLDEKGKQYLGFVTGGARRMEMLVKDLLAYTQSAAQVPDEVAITQAPDALSKALSNLAEVIRESDAEVSFDTLPCVRIHEVQLQQLFQNLISNAIKYRRDGVRPRIHIAADQHGADWLFSVRDNGLGIPPEYADRIFGIFKRLHTDKKYSGTGIGLAICQKIIERNGGRIWVESEGDGQGSTFYFTLPSGEHQ